MTPKETTHVLIRIKEMWPKLQRRFISESKLVKPRNTKEWYQWEVSDERAQSAPRCGFCTEV